MLEKSGFSLARAGVMAGLVGIVFLGAGFFSQHGNKDPASSVHLSEALWSGVDRLLAHVQAEAEAIRVFGINLHDASNIAAVVVEPIAGSTGVLVPPKGYLERLREICDRHGLLLIFDEVITGFGRLGAPFAADYFGVTPDLMTTAKGITNGTVPCGAVFASRQVHDALMNGPTPGIRAEEPPAQGAGGDRCGAPVGISGDGVHGLWFLLRGNYRINAAVSVCSWATKPDSFAGITRQPLKRRATKPQTFKYSFLPPSHRAKCAFATCGESRNNSSAASRAASSKSRSSARSAKRNIGTPLCRAPSNSPGPRNCRSCRAISKPSVFS